MKYKKKPVVIDAFRFTGSSTSAAIVEAWIKEGREPFDCAIHTCDIRELKIQTLEGEMTASPGDWIIKGVNGEFYPCKPDIFEQTYEAVTE